MTEEITQLLVEQLKDAHSAERQTLRAMPRLARQASSQSLKDALEAHVQETEGQVERLEQALQTMGAKPGRRVCEGMRGLIEEAQGQLKEYGKGPLADVLIIAAQQRVEHYEIASYGTMAALAKTAGEREVASLLAETLREEEQTDKALSRLAQREVNPAAGGRGRASQDAPRRGRASAATAERAGTRSKATPKTRPKAAKAASTTRPKARRNSGAKVTTDHDEIRRWAEERGGTPAAVERTHEGGDTGIIRIMFPDNPRSEHEALVEIPWEEFFRQFEESKLALLHDEGSLFSKLIGRDTAKRRASGDHGAAKGSGPRGGAGAGRGRKAPAGGRAASARGGASPRRRSGA
ncbi:ferritin-like domain-containing protein [Falsiroseomonas sp.]|uniref:YciE/YciF ferroxidase family protein n=1 Tax=Falsiroseomonas sp. TaxID=2870721 RepID=UPI0035634361